MDKRVKADIWEEPAISMEASLGDFDGNLQKWKDSFYEIWRYQMTWNFAYRIEACEGRSRGVFIRLRVRPDFKDSAEDMLEMLGYRNVSVNEEKVGIVESYTLPEDWWDIALD